jgi:hypothetical protein
MAAVNFEDLFDFSPQGEQHPDTEELDTYVEKTAESLFRPRVITSSIATKSYPVVAGDRSTFKLSASLPNTLSAR